MIEYMQFRVPAYRVITDFLYVWAPYIFIWFGCNKIVRLVLSLHLIYSYEQKHKIYINIVC